MKNLLLLLAFSPLSLWSQNASFFSNEISWAIAHKDFKRALQLCDKAKPLAENQTAEFRSLAYEGLNDLAGAVAAADKILPEEKKVLRIESIRSNGLNRQVSRGAFAEALRLAEEIPEPRGDYYFLAVSKARAGLGEYNRAVEEAGRISNTMSRTRQMAEVYSTRKWYNKAMQYYDAYVQSRGKNAAIEFANVPIKDRIWLVPAHGIFHSFEQSATNIGTITSIPIEEFRYEFQSVFGLHYSFYISFNRAFTASAYMRDLYLGYIRTFISTSRTRTYTSLVKSSQLCYLGSEDIQSTNASFWVQEDAKRSGASGSEAIVIWYESTEKNDESTWHFFLLPSSDVKYTSEIMGYGVTEVTIHCPSSLARDQLKKEWPAWVAQYFER